MKKKFWGILLAFLIAENRFLVLADTSDRIVIFIAFAMTFSILDYLENVRNEEKRMERWNNAARDNLRRSHYPTNR